MQELTNFTLIHPSQLDNRLASVTEKISAEMFLVIKVPKGWNFKERKWGMKTKSNAVGMTIFLD